MRKNKVDAHREATVALSSRMRMRRVKKESALDAPHIHSFSLLTASSLSSRSNRPDAPLSHSSAQTRLSRGPLFPRRTSHRRPLPWPRRPGAGVQGKIQEGTTVGKHRSKTRTTEAVAAQPIPTPVLTRERWLFIGSASGYDRFKVRSLL